MIDSISESRTGRKAALPTRIPARGWIQILRRVVHEVSDDRVMLVAAGVTFYLLLALVPTLTAIVSIYSLLTDPASVNQHLSLINAFLPDGLQEILIDQLTRLTGNTDQKLGLAAVIAILIALWSANAGVKGLFQAMNVAYDETEKRGFFKLTFVTLSFTLVGVCMIVLLMAGLVVLPLVMSSLGLSDTAGVVVQVTSKIALIVLVWVGLAALYRWGPSRSSARWAWISPGAIVALAIIAAGSALFSWYVANFGSYNETYGSLGAAIGAMTWLWINAIFILLGAELNAEMEHQTAVDTTTGPPAPMGQRGAVMADTVAG